MWCKLSRLFILGIDDSDIVVYPSLLEAKIGCSLPDSLLSTGGFDIEDVCFKPIFFCT